MAAEVVMVDEIEFPKSVTPTSASKSLDLLGHGITDIEIHFLQIKFTAIGVYIDADVASYLQAWRGKTAAELMADHSLFDTLIQAPVENFIRVVVIKEIKGSQYGLQVENAVRDRLVAIDKYEDEEEEALGKVVEFFQGKYMKKNSLITYHFPANSKTVEVSFVSEGDKVSRMTVENEDVGRMIKKWYLGGPSAVSPSTINSLTESIAELLKVKDVVMVDEIEFPISVIPSASSKPLDLLGHGITDIEIHFLQIKFTAIGIYVDAGVASHLQAWKGKTAAELSADDSVFDTLIQAPVEKFIRVVVIKEIKGSQYGLQLENAVRDRLVAIDKYEDEEEEVLGRVVEFFQGKYMKKGSLITYHFPANAKTVEVSFVSDEKKGAKITVENEHVGSMIQKWYLGGSTAVSSTVIACLADGISSLLK